MTPESARSELTLDDLRARVLSGTGWTLLRFAGQNGIRMAGNLVLTRLLFPEAFGLMALVYVVIEGLALFSDMGLRQSVVANPRGEEPAFLRTVWTIQVVRGAVICSISAALSVPIARFYGEPQLASLIAVTSLSALLGGLSSANGLLLGRKLALGRLTVLELSVQCVVTGGMIAYAAMSPTLWVLPAGALASRVLWCAVSHRLLPGPSMAFRWDRETRVEVMRFGRWILVSSVLGYIVNNLDRLALGTTMTMAQLGAYSIAALFVRLVLQVQRRLKEDVLFPVLSRMRDSSSAQRRHEIARIRLAIIALTHPVLIGLAVLGPEVIDLLYDERYASAGWMLQVLATGFLFTTAVEPADSVLLARGDSFRFMQLLAMRASIMCAAMAVGAWQYGSTGVVVAVASAELLAYPALVWSVRPHDGLLPALELGSVVASGSLVLLALLAKSLFFGG